MTKSEHVRELAAEGKTPQQIRELTDYDRRLIEKALRSSPARGRPRVERCKHCGQPIPAKQASRTSTAA